MCGISSEMHVSRSIQLRRIWINDVDNVTKRDAYLPKFHSCSEKNCDTSINISSRVFYHGFIAKNLCFRSVVSIIIILQNVHCLHWSKCIVLYCINRRNRALTVVNSLAVNDRLCSISSIRAYLVNNIC